MQQPDEASDGGQAMDLQLSKVIIKSDEIN